MKLPRSYMPRTAWWRVCWMSTGLIGVLGALSAVEAGDIPANTTEARRRFDIPAANADAALKAFSEQSSHGVIYSTDGVKDVRTNAVQGNLTPSEALRRLVEGTGLLITRDLKTGAFAVRKGAADPNAASAAPAPASDRLGENEARRNGSQLERGPLASGPAGRERGTIVGQVSNRATRSNLAQAQIVVNETGREYYTERDGVFLITDLAPGAYTLVVEYPGLDQQRIPVDVAADQTKSVNITLDSDVYQMSAYVVAGQREGNAAAVAEQHNAPNVTNIITADAFGDITKANIGNIIRRIPGVAGYNNDEIDTSDIMVRGMGANLTSIDLDGTRAVSPSGRGTRTQNINAFPVDMIEKIEVTKATLAEDDADSLGGRVKLTTRSAFDLNERLINVRAGISYNETYGKGITNDGKDYLPASYGFNYSDVLDLFGQPRSLGILFTASYDKFLDARSNVEFAHTNTTGGNPSATTTRDYSQFDFASVDLHRQERLSGSLRLEYKIGAHTRLGVSALLSRNIADYDRARMGTNLGTIDTALSDPDPNVTVVNNAAYLGFGNEVARQTDSYNLRAFGTSQVGGVKLVYDFNRQRAERFIDSDQAQFVSNRKFSYTFDWRPNPEFPYPMVRTGLDPFTDRFTDTASNALEVRRLNAEKEIWAGRFEAEKPFEWRFPFKLKTGLRYREEIQNDDQNRFVATVASGIGRDLSGYLNNQWRTAAGNGSYPIGAVPGTEKLLRSHVRYIGNADPRLAWAYDPSLVTMNVNSTLQQCLINDSKVNEKIYAGFLQGSAKVGRLTVQGGARYERTDLRETYGVRNRGVTDVLAQWSGRRHVAASYDDVFPSLHLRYSLTKAWVIRAALSTTIGRPDLKTVAADGDINLSSRSIAIANPDLKPQRATNYDLSLEYYVRPAGVLSVGVFQKDIRDGIGSVATSISEAAAADLGAPLTNPSPTAMTWTLTTDQNNRDACVKGLEFSYSQQLSFLPGAFRGLGVFANYTWLQATGYRSSVGAVAVPEPIVNFIPRSGSAGLSYTYGRWDARLQVNYHSAFCDSYNRSSPVLRSSYRGERYQWDFNGRCKLTRKLSVFANLSNFLSQDEPDYVGWVAPDRRDQTIGYSFIITGGVSARF